MKLKIHSEADLNLHPIARKIPFPIWADSSSSELSVELNNFEQSLFELSLDEIFTLIPRLQKSSKSQKHKALICIIFGHPEFELNNFISFLKAIVPDDNIYEYLCIKSLISEVSDDYLNEGIRMLVPGRELSLYSNLVALDNSRLITHLLSHFPDSHLDMIMFNDFHAFKMAALFGHLNFMHLMLQLINSSPKARFPMFEADLRWAFILAVKHNHLDCAQFILNHTLLTKSRHYIMRSVGQPNYHPNVLVDICKKGQLEVFNFLFSAFPEMVMSHFKEDNFIFPAAISSGNIELINKFDEIWPNSCILKMRLNNYSLVISACLSGNLTLVQNIRDGLSDEFEKMIPAFVAGFARSAGNGHLKILKYLKKLLPEQFDNMIQHDEYAAFCLAAKYGQLSIIKALVAWAQEQKVAMMKARDYCAFKLAAENGHLAIIEYFQTHFSKHFLAMIRSENYLAFNNAVKNENIEIINIMLISAFAEKKNMILNKNCMALKHAAYSRNKPLFLKFIGILTFNQKNFSEVSPSMKILLEDMLANGQIDLLEYIPEECLAQFDFSKQDFILAMVRNNNLAGLQFIVQQMKPEEVLNYLLRKEYKVLQIAIESNSLEIIDYLLNHFKDKQVEIIRPHLHWLSVEYRKDHVPVSLNYMLNYSVVLDYQIRFNFEKVEGFIEQKLHELNMRIHLFFEQGINEIFNLDPGLANYYFVIAQYMIKKNTTVSNKNFKTMFKIPSLRALILQNAEQILLQICIKSNAEILETVLPFSEFLTLVEKNDFYYYFTGKFGQTLFSYKEKIIKNNELSFFFTTNCDKSNRSKEKYAPSRLQLT